MQGNLSKNFLKANEKIFNEGPFAEGIKWRLTSMPDVTVFVASIDGNMVGFKAGYATAINKYYSWLGGVDPEFRQKGIGKNLMEAQHNWIEQNTSYSVVKTQTAADNAAMIGLNRRFGFEITGNCKKHNKPYVIMEKIFGKEQM